MTWLYERVKGMHSPYSIVLAKVLEEALRLRLESYRNPLAMYDYAEAIDAFVDLFPDHARKDFQTKVIGLVARAGVRVEGFVTASRVLHALLEACPYDEFVPKPEITITCLAQAREDLNGILQLAISVAHRHGLLVVSRVVNYGEEA